MIRKNAILFTNDEVRVLTALRRVLHGQRDSWKITGEFEAIRHELADSRDTEVRDVTDGLDRGAA